ncbi:MAG: hypothetical protein WKF87_11685 [Chryseolinea sp.]
MSGLSFDVLRTGKKYRLTNYGESHEFVIEQIMGNGDFKVKDVHTLERFRLKELITYGKGKDFLLEDL